MHKKLIVLTTLLLGLGGCCFRLSAGYVEMVRSQGGVEALLKQYPDPEAESEIKTLLMVLMGHHTRAGAQSILQQLPPNEFRELIKKVKELYPRAKGRRIYIRLVDERHIIPSQTISLQLMTDDDTFSDLARRLRALYKIPETTMILFDYHPTWYPSYYSIEDPILRIRDRVVDKFQHTQEFELNVIIDVPNPKSDTKKNQRSCIIS